MAQAPEIDPAVRFRHWEKTKDIIDQLIDMILNYRQSGHPGGSRSRVHALTATLLGDVMRWDIRHPEKRFGDRFILVAGHTAPVVYCTLAVLNEALRAKHQRTGDPRYSIPDAEHRALFWEDLMGFRRHGGLPGHAEMQGKTLFFKFNTGPSGHGSPPAAGEAMALKRAGAGEVKVFAFEGEGGLTTGASHETRNSAWGLGLDNLIYVVDWNDFGIDDHSVSSVVHGTPRDWFEPAGWRVIEAKDGSDFPQVHAALVETVHGENPPGVPRMCFLRTRKGRGYLKYDYASHGSPHAPANSPLYWDTKRPFAEAYDVDFEGFGQPAPSDPGEFRRQVETNMRKVVEVLHRDAGLVDYLADTLVRIGDSVPERLPTFRLDTSKNPWKDLELTDFRKYPASMWARPGDKQPNRAALARWGSWANAWGRRKYGRPLFLGLSADLAESTNLAGLAKDFDDQKGWGKYERNNNPEGVLLPQEITEFTNAGMSVGIATVNFSERPFEEWDGLAAACSTYGSFSYLKYGPMRLFSQLAQDSEIQVGKVISDRGAFGTRDRRRQPDALRHLRAGSDPAFPGRTRDGSASVGAQRGSGRDRGGARQRRAHPGLAFDEACHRDPRPRRPGNGLALRGSAGSLPHPRFPSWEAQDGNHSGPGNALDPQHRPHSSRAGQGGAQRQDRGDPLTPALESAGSRLARSGSSGRGLARFDLHLEPSEAPALRLAAASDRGRIRPDERLRPAMADRRKPRRGHRGGAPVAGMDPQGNRAVRPRSGASAGPDPADPGEGRTRLRDAAPAGSRPSSALLLSGLRSVGGGWRTAFAVPRTIQDEDLAVHAVLRRGRLRDRLKRMNVPATSSDHLPDLGWHSRNLNHDRLLP